MSLGYKRPIELDDLGAIPARHEAKYNYNKFNKALKVELVSTICTLQKPGF